MLCQIELKNFRCFEQHVVYFKKNNIAVGKNNAGKSTFIEAIRLLSIASQRFKKATYTTSPDWLDFSLSTKGFLPTIDRLEFDFDNICYRGEDRITEISGLFENDIKITIYIKRQQRPFVLVWHGNILITRRAMANNLDLEPIFVLPQITDLDQNERLLDADFFKRIKNQGRLFSKRFRNNVFYTKQANLTSYESFVTLARSTWNGFDLTELFVSTDDDNHKILNMLVRDYDYVSEIINMGHGLQMWMQCMWFLSLMDTKSTIVLDEPDVYMHADLQKKLISLVYNTYDQVIIATHSLEIISAVQPNEILIISKKDTSSLFADSIPAVQKLIGSIGSSYNMSLIKFFDSKVALWTEGPTDIDILYAFQKTLFPNSRNDLQTIPQFTTNGWTGWDLKKQEIENLKNAQHSKVKKYIVFDRDYHRDIKIRERNNYAKEKKINLLIWNKKEIENYLIVPSIIARIVKRKCKDKDLDLIEKTINDFLKKITDEMKPDLISNTANAIRNEDHIHDGKDASAAILEVDSYWDNLYERINHLPGKDGILPKLRNKIQDTYKVSISDKTIATEFTSDEIHDDIKMLLNAIENEKDFDS